MLQNYDFKCYILTREITFEHDKSILHAISEYTLLNEQDAFSNI